jgi:hypothetical protein
LPVLHLYRAFKVFQVNSEKLGVRSKVSVTNAAKLRLYFSREPIIFVKEKEIGFLEESYHLSLIISHL